MILQILDQTPQGPLKYYFFGFDHVLLKLNHLVENYNHGCLWLTVRRDIDHYDVH